MFSSAILVLLAALSGGANAQSINVTSTWIAGTSAANSASVKGTLGVPSTTIYPGGRVMPCLAITVSDTNYKVYMYGGQGYSTASLGYQKDFWRYNLATSEWTMLAENPTTTAVTGTRGTESSTTFPGAFGRSSCLINPRDNYLYMFGGVSGGRYNDMWRYNPTSGYWAWLGGGTSTTPTINTESSTIFPSTRRNAAMVAHPTLNILIMMSGFGADLSGTTGDMNDMWRFNLDTNAWTWFAGSVNSLTVSSVFDTKGAATASNFPGGRNMHTTWIHPTTYLMYLFGGLTGTGSPYFNDMWSYDFSSGYWTWISGGTANNRVPVYGSSGVFDATFTPGSRASAIFSTVYGTTYLSLYGGRGYGINAATYNANLNEMWFFDYTTNQWAWIVGSNEANTYGTMGVTSSGPYPQGRNLYGCASMAFQKSSVIFGGLTGTANYMNDMWKLDFATPDIVSSTAWSSAASSTSSTDVVAITLTTTAEIVASSTDFSTTNVLITSVASLADFSTTNMIDTSIVSSTDVGTTSVIGLASAATSSASDMSSAVATSSVVDSAYSATATSTLPDVLLTTAVMESTSSYGYVTNVVDSSSSLSAVGSEELSTTIIIEATGTSTDFDDATVSSSITESTTAVSVALSSSTTDISSSLLISSTLGTYMPSSTIDVSSSASSSTVGFSSVSATINVTGTWIAGTSSANSASVKGTVGVASTSIYPGGRVMPCLAITVSDTNYKIYLYGGQGYSTATLGYQKDFWRYNLATSEWTMLAENPTTTAVTGTRGLESSTTFPGAFGRSACLINPRDNYLYIFGGINSGRYNDMWRYNATSGYWAWLGGGTSTTATINTESSTIFPSTRRNAAMVAHPTLNMLIMMSGFGADSGGSTTGDLNDMWKFNLDTNAWTWFAGSISSLTVSSVFDTKGAATSANYPGGRSMHTTWIHPTTYAMYMFGGLTGTGTAYFNDMWSYDFTSGFWTWISGGSVNNQLPTYGYSGAFDATYTPGARASAIFSKVYGTTYLSLYGGRGYGINAATYNANLNEMWMFDYNTNQWAWIVGANEANSYGTKGVTSSGPYPQGRNLYVCAPLAFQKSMILFGGFTGTTSYMNDMWQLDFSVLDSTSSSMSEMFTITSYASLTDVALSTSAVGMTLSSDILVTTSHSDVLTSSSSDSTWAISSLAPSSSAEQFLSMMETSYTMVETSSAVMETSSAMMETSSAVLETSSAMMETSSAVLKTSSAMMETSSAVLETSSPMSSSIMATSTDASTPYAAAPTLSSSAGESSSLFMETSSARASSSSTGVTKSSIDISTSSADEVSSSSSAVMASSSISSSAAVPTSALSSSAIQSSLLVSSSAIPTAASSTGASSSAFASSSESSSATSSSVVVTSSSASVSSIVVPTSSIEAPTTSAADVATNTSTLLSSPSPTPAGTFVSVNVSATWIAGTSAANSVSVKGTFGVPSTAIYPGGQVMPCVAITVSDTNYLIYVYGGQGYSTATFGYQKDFWRYNLATSEWTMLPENPTNVAVTGTRGIESNSTFPGTLGRMACLINPSDNYLYMFGGVTGARYNDMWRYNPISGYWAWLGGGTSTTPTINAESSTIFPSTRRNAAMVAHPTLNILVIMSGFGADFSGTTGDMNDMWKFNLDTNAWTWFAGSANSLTVSSVFGTKGVASSSSFPGGRNMHTTWIDPSTAVMYMFGGLIGTGIGYMNDLWSYDFSTGYWTWISGSTSNNHLPTYGSSGIFSASYTPGARATAIFSKLYGTTYLSLYGGRGYGINSATYNANLNEMWFLDYSINQWAWIVGSNEANSYGSLGVTSPDFYPQGRNLYSGAALAFQKSVVLFGGLTGTANYMDDMWKLDFSIGGNVATAISASVSTTINDAETLTTFVTVTSEAIMTGFTLVSSESLSMATSVANNLPTVLATTTIRPTVSTSVKQTSSVKLSSVKPTSTIKTASSTAKPVTSTNPTIIVKTTVKATSTTKATSTRKTSSSVKPTSSTKATSSRKTSSSVKPTSSTKATSSRKTSSSVKPTSSTKATSTRKASTSTAKATSTRKTSSSVKPTSTKKSTITLKTSTSSTKATTTRKTSSSTKPTTSAKATSSTKKVTTTAKLTTTFKTSSAKASVSPTPQLVSLSRRSYNDKPSVKQEAVKREAEVELTYCDDGEKPCENQEEAVEEVEPTCIDDGGKPSEEEELLAGEEVEQTSTDNPSEEQEEEEEVVGRTCSDSPSEELEELGSDFGYNVETAPIVVTVELIGAVLCLVVLLVLLVVKMRGGATRRSSFASSKIAIAYRPVMQNSVMVKVSPKSPKRVSISSDNSEDDCV